MQKNNKEIIEVTDEGIIFMNYLPADYEVLFDLIMSKSCKLSFASEAAWLSLTLGIQNWMFENKTVEEYQEVTNFINKEYKASIEQINL